LNSHKATMAAHTAACICTAIPSFLAAIGVAEWAILSTCSFWRNQLIVQRVTSTDCAAYDNAGHSFGTATFLKPEQPDKK